MKDKEQAVAGRQDASATAEATGDSGGRQLIRMGRILGAFGIKGWVKVDPYGSPAGLAGSLEWWIEQHGSWRRFPVAETEAHDRTVVARPQGCDDRDVAAAYRGCDVALERSAFRTPAKDEYYQADLVGLDVVNMQGDWIGRLGGWFSNGAHEVMRLEGPGGVERLLPFVPAVVKAVDPERKRIEVDWGADW